MYDFYLELIARGIIVWYSDNTFRPKNKITRLEFLKVVFLFFNIELHSDNKNYFIDISSYSWWKKYVDTWVRLWYISTQNRYFRPNDFISRIESLKIILKINKVDLSQFEYKDRFNDVVSNLWYSNIVEYAARNKLFNFDKNFYPNKKVTRWELVYILSKFQLFS